MSLIIRTLIKDLKIIQIYYDKSIYDEEHWIYNSLEEMIDKDDNYDQNDIKIYKSKCTLKV